MSAVVRTSTELYRGRREGRVRKVKEGKVKPNTINTTNNNKNNNNNFIYLIASRF